MKIPGFRYVGTSFEPAFVTEDGRVRIHQATPRKWAVYGAGGTRFHKEVSGRDAAIREARRLASETASEDDRALEAAKRTSPHHAATKKKSPAQLDREIAEALSQEPSMTTEQIARYRSGRKWGWPADLAFKVATDRPLSRTPGAPGRRSHATKTGAARTAMTAEQFNALAERSAETIRVDDFEALLAAVRKLQPRTIIGVQGEYGGKKKIAEGRFIRLAETGPIAASWSRRAIVEEIVPGWRLEGAPRQLDVSPEQLRALPKTKFKRR